MVQVVAARRLFERGIMVKDGGALERLAEADHVVFDKTGTLTEGVPRLEGGEVIDAVHLGIAASLAAHSRHPYAQSIAAAGRAGEAAIIALTNLREETGAGLEGRSEDTVYRLGRPDWAIDGHAANREDQVVLSADGRRLCSFRFRDGLRPGAREAVAALRARGLSVEILSGDREEPVRLLAMSLGVPWRAAVSPAGKVAHIAALAAVGRKVLMVGDGLNDPPSLAAAHVSMATASAADVGRNAADIVLLRQDLMAVPGSIAIARDARNLVRQNLLLAVAYNALAVPLAVLGLVTPLIAAIAMSASSVSVVANALRLGWRRDDRRAAGAGVAPVAPAASLEPGR